MIGIFTLKCQADGCEYKVNTLSPYKTYETLYLLVVNLPSVQKRVDIEQICQICLLKWAWHSWSKWTCISCIALAFVGLPGWHMAMLSGLVLSAWIFLGYSFTKQ